MEHAANARKHINEAREKFFWGLLEANLPLDPIVAEVPIGRARDAAMHALRGQSREDRARVPFEHLPARNHRVPPAAARWTGHGLPVIRSNSQPRHSPCPSAGVVHAYPSASRTVTSSVLHSHETRRSGSHTRK